MAEQINTTVREFKSRLELDKYVIIQRLQVLQMIIITYLAYTSFSQSYRALNKAFPSLQDDNFWTILFDIKVENSAVVELIINGLQLLISILSIYLIFFASEEQAISFIENIPLIGKKIKSQKKTLQELK